jgi:hypothetical protein
MPDEIGELLRPKGGGGVEPLRNLLERCWFEQIEVSPTVLGIEDNGHDTCAP